MALQTICSIDDVRAAGNYTPKVETITVTFYLELVGIMLRELIGVTNYEKALLTTSGYTELELARLKKAEALLAVGFSLPAVSSITTAQGTLAAYNFGRAGEVEVKSIAKEIMELASNYIIMGKALIPTELFVDQEEGRSVWSTVFMRVFPGLDEMPTVATVHSEAESIIQTERGDVAYEPSMG